MLRKTYQVFVSATVLPATRTKKCRRCVYKDFLIGKYLTKVNCIIEQNRKLKVMSIYMVTYKNWLLYRTKFLKILSHRDILCRVKNCPQKQKTCFQRFFLAMKKFYIFKNFILCNITKRQWQLVWVFLEAATGGVL